MIPLSDSPYDLLVIGGGINGVGIARDAAGRGLGVLLCEKSDLASATSSASTKLIHGGLRYLEHYEFRLVREALAEREVLLRLAPHIIRPLTFVMAHDAHLRPAWMIRIGLLLYDHLGGRRTLAGSRGINLHRDPAGRPLKPAFHRGFTYSDCWVDDARLVVLNAIAVRTLGGTVLTRTAVADARRIDGLWHATVIDQRDRTSRTVTARAVVNAAGPWVHEAVTGVLRLESANQVRLIKGSHIVVPRLFTGEQAYIFQHPDRRVIFAIPYEERFTLIGTTDIPVAHEPHEVAIDDDEIAYLCEAVSRYFTVPVTPASVVWTYSGVRPLYDDGKSDPSAITRDYVLELDAGGAPALSVYGGKITTYRRLAEHALEKLAPFFPGLKPAWTRHGALPGGDLGTAGVADFADGLARAYPGLDRALLAAYARRHGSRTRDLLGDAKGAADLGEDFGGALYAREVEWLLREEWAETAEDVLWRRTKRGLHLTPGGREKLALWLSQRRAA
ncbi:MAG TPA: glycerol-3-phosphate dehydrogenase [Candidatus Sulfotelmatobacter sp.]|nr:glycerol-3-phosphate dehydrogenase [Candidatus Sulfotelmatobacter sp.]